MTVRLRSPHEATSGTYPRRCRDKAHGGFCEIKEEADHYPATLILAVDRTATVAADEMRGPPPPQRDPATIVPGVARSEQKNG